MRVRAGTLEDSGSLHELMLELAAIENYDEQFAVSVADIEKYGFGESRLFESFVAEQGSELLGMAIIFWIPWTYDRLPTMVLKELVVRKSARGNGVGSALIQYLANYAKEKNCQRVVWQVLKDNHLAKEFYQRFGATPDPVWEPWILGSKAIDELLGGQ